MVLYESTRGGNEKITSAEAIKRGIAPDGGLYVPCKFHKLNLKEIKDLVDMTYPERAVAILRHFLDDFSEEELIDCVNSAYSHKFTHEKVAPVVELNESLFLLELWHGPTCAFKDMALQILPHLLVKSMKKTGEKSKVIILTATSGDTGKAALEGFADVEGTGIIVFYPDNGVSEIQKYQMITQTGENVKVFGVRGNFDDTQTGVKRIFTDKELISFMEARNLKFSSANSINWGRLAPQIVYYFSAYADLIKENRIAAGDKINFVVPTGNFGNILAGFYAAKMGLPVNRLVCASNDNNILTDFIRTGCYDKRREFIKTVSPSMDILISSNLERLLYEVTNHDGKKVSQWMNELQCKRKL
jgi:threonine synthase